MKLSEQLKQDHESGDFGKALEGYAEKSEALESALEEAKKLSSSEIVDMKYQTDFEKCTTYTRRNDRCEIKCNLGFWCVDGPYGLALINEAYHYFQQYKFDGEYDKLLNA